MYLEVAYFPTYLPMFETYFLQNWLPRWDQIVTQLRFIRNWVITDIQWMVRWWVLVHCGWLAAHVRVKFFMPVYPPQYNNIHKSSEANSQDTNAIKLKEKKGPASFLKWHPLTIEIYLSFLASPVFKDLFNAVFFYRFYFGNLTKKKKRKLLTKATK
jgi:hypothetical protein